MIRIVLRPDADGRLVSIESEGHAGLAPRGSDVLCAAVSAVLETLAGGITEILKQGTVQRGEGRLTIRVDRPGQESELLFGAALLSFRKMQADHPERIRIEILPETKS